MLFGIFLGLLVFLSIMLLIFGDSLSEKFSDRVFSVYPILVLFGMFIVLIKVVLDFERFFP